MFDCNNLKKAKSITVAPIKEFALVHGREKITEEKVLAEEKLKDLEALIYSTSANCHLAKEEEIKYFVDFLTYFCKGGEGYNSLSLNGKGYIDAMYTVANQNECFMDILKCSCSENNEIFE